MTEIQPTASAAGFLIVLSSGFGDAASGEAGGVRWTQDARPAEPLYGPELPGIVVPVEDYAVGSVFAYVRMLLQFFL